TIYAAGGCAIAVSRDGGTNWTESILPGEGCDPGKERQCAWHIAVSQPVLRFPSHTYDYPVWAAGSSDQSNESALWYSPDGGTSWYLDQHVGLTRDSSFGDRAVPCYAGTCGTQSAPGILAAAREPFRVYLAAVGKSNGPAYYQQTCAPDCIHCGTMPV